MPSDPVHGDNFRCVGPWEITAGQAWRHWRMEALLACRQAAVAAGDAVAARRFTVEMRKLEQAPDGGTAPRRTGRDRS